MKGHGIPIFALVLLGTGCVLQPVPLFDRDQDGVTADQDCDDGDASVGARYQDADGDGHGDVAAIVDCTSEAASDVADDCDDQAPNVYPGAPEACNGVDDDCDGAVDEDLSLISSYEDADGDGYGDPDTGIRACDLPSDRVTNDEDCDDTDPHVHPGADETCNLEDDDCDGRVDEGVGSSYYPDTDGDGHGQQGARPETACTPPEGYVASNDDCDDTNPATYPGAQELCNGLDDDRDGQTDEEGATVYHEDRDHDGYGDPASAVTACAPPVGFVADASDCDDARSDVHPGATETCNATDDDCDGQIDEDATIVAVAGGIFHSLGLCSDGTVWAWGNNDMGQLGDGTTQGRLLPAQVPGLDHIVAIAAGGYHSVALQRTAEGQSCLWVWGDNEEGQLGDGTHTNRRTPVRLEDFDGVDAVDAGLDYTVAVRSGAQGGAGSVWTWGNNDMGQLGDGTTDARPAPAAVPSLQGITQVRAGMRHVLALGSSGTAGLGPMWAWGANGKGQVGDGTRENRLSPYLIPGLSETGAIAAGGEHSLALTFEGDHQAGTLWSWGDNTYGQLGDGTTADRLQPAPVNSAPAFVSIEAGYHHSLAIQANDTGDLAWSWGSNSDGQLGNGGGETSLVPVQLTSLSSVTALAAGAAHSLAITATDGGQTVLVWAWGSNDYGQLGDGTQTDRGDPVLVDGF